MPEIDIRERGGRAQLHVLNIPGKKEPVILRLRSSEARRLLDEAAENFQTTRRKLIGKIRKEGPIEI